MPTINSYLTFNGNCREAMLFYQQCLGGDLTLQTIGESPLSEKMPERMRASIVHSTLIADDIVLMGSDMVGEQGLQKGNAVSLLLNCNTPDEAYALYQKLSEGGKATHPMHTSFFGALFGDLTDRFGNQWLLHCNDAAAVRTIK